MFVRPISTAPALAKYVFHRDWQAGQSSDGLFSSATSINFGSLGQCALWINMQKRANTLIHRANAIKIRFRQLDRSDCARFKAAQMLGG